MAQQNQAPPQGSAGGLNMPPPAACIPHVPPLSPLRPHFPPSQPTSSTHPPTHCTTTGTLAALWHPTPLCTPQPPPCGAARSVIFSAPLKPPKNVVLKSENVLHPSIPSRTVSL
jgi:hypothetical protein